MSKIPEPSDNDVVIAFDETWWRFVAYCGAVVAAGPDPDEATFFALIELQFAADHWRERFLAGLARSGIPLDEILDAA